MGINIRLLLWAALAALLYMNYEAWMRDYPAATAASSSIESGNTKSAQALRDSVPQAASSAPPSGASAVAEPSSGAAPGAAAPPPVAPAATADVPSLGSPPTLTPSAAGAAGAAPTQLLHVVTDVLDISINLKGGELDRAELLEYPLRKDAPGTPVRLLSREPPAALYLLQSGLAGGAGEAAPTHLATWTAAAQSYTLAPGANELRVPLTWSDAGLQVTKTFVFKRGQYAIALDYDVKNDSSSD